MRRQRVKLALLTIVLVPAISLGQFTIQNLGSQRAGTAVFPFLRIATSAYGAGMGGAGVALAHDAAAAYYNPSLISSIPKRDVVLFHSEMPAEIAYDAFSFSMPFGRSSALGVSFGILHMEPMIETTEFMPFGTGRTFTFSDQFLAVTLSKKLSDRFAFGTTVKYVDETLDDVHMNAYLFDFGTLYDTGFRSLRISSSLTNFGDQSGPAGTFSKYILNQDGDEVLADSLVFQSFSPPTAFRLGAAYDIVESNNGILTTAFQLAHPADNAEYYSFGLEYKYATLLSLRSGYVINQEGFGFSFGVGFSVSLPGDGALRLDYAYSDALYLTSPQRFSIGISL